MAGEQLPRDWRLVKLGELGEVNRGRSRHRPRYAEHLYGGPYPFIQTGDIKSSGGRITSFQQTYSEAGLAQSKMWPAGTMCITIAANIAETAILTFPACFPDSVVGFVADSTKCDVRFIEYTFRNLRRRIQHEASGSVQDNINLATLERLRFPLPPLRQQQAIACILGSLDDKIELNRRMNRTLEEMARAIFKSWFIDFDPVRAKATVRREHPKWTDDQVSRAACPRLKPEIARLFPDSFEDSELGEIPKGWRVKALDELARFLNGLALQKFPPEDGDSLPVIKIAQLRAGNTVGADRASARLNPDYIVQDGDILFSWSGSLECVLWAGGPGALNQHLFKVTSNEYPKWLCYLAVHQHLDEFRHIAASKATTMGHIQRHHLAGAKIAVPVDENLLSAIDAVLDPMFESLWQREVSCRTLAALRDALLPKLVSGELRIPDAERIAGRCA